MTESYWQQLSKLNTNQARVDFQKLRGPVETDVAVIGGGITGLSTALELLYRGRSVTVFESGTIGCGTTGRSSGHLDAHPEIGARKLIKLLGREKARQLVKLRQDAITGIESRACVKSDFSSIPAYMYTENYRDLERLRDEFDAAIDIGLKASWQDSLPLSFAAFGYRIEGMARIDSYAYARALADLVVAAGGEIYEHVMIMPPELDGEPVLESATGKIRCNDVVCAVHCNFTSFQKLYLQTPPYQSYIIAVKVENAPADALYWDNAEPYFYTRRVSDNEPDVLIIGGRDHRTGNGDPVDAREQLERYARERYQVVEVLGGWSAELFEPTDGLPMIGSVGGFGADGHVWVATGFSGVGLTWGTASGWLLADQMIGRKSILVDELSPRRFEISSIANIAAEQLGAVSNYSERVLPADSVDASSLGTGEGKVGKVDGKFVAVCRDAEGCVHMHSPICTHQGGVLHWNAMEQTWDCPVHGGRFTADGTRFYGPPSSDLEAIDLT